MGNLICVEMPLDWRNKPRTGWNARSTQFRFLVSSTNRSRRYALAVVDGSDF